MIYVTFMVSVDVPTYVKNHLADSLDGKKYYNLSDGLSTLLNKSEHTVTWSYADWKYDICWMTLYFSVACWASIGIINSPRMDQGLVNQIK